MAKDTRIGITGGGSGAARPTGRASVGKSAVPSKEYRARKASGITNEGGKSVTPIYKESIPPASVKVVPPKSTNENAVTNNRSTLKTNRAKSGATAKSGAAYAEKFYATQPKAKPIKINSNK